MRLRARLRRHSNGNFHAVDAIAAIPGEAANFCGLRRPHPCGRRREPVIIELTTISVIGSFAAVICERKCWTMGNLPVGMLHKP